MFWPFVQKDKVIHDSKISIALIRKPEMNQEEICQDWNERGFSFGIFRNPTGKVWADFVHQTDGLVMLAEGEIELEIEGKTQRPLIRQEVFIPANAIHTVRNVGNTNNVWYYGYRSQR